ncbi:MFS transporter [soil metagenome]
MATTSLGTPAGEREPKTSWLERIGLHRPELRAWAMYDWANSAMVTTVRATVFPTFFAAVAMAGYAEGAAMQRYGIINSTGLILAALLSPILGTISDYAGNKKRMLGGFMGLGIAAVACMFFIQHGQWLFAALLFILANIGAASSFVFYDALLPHVAREDEMDRVSTAGYALGYLGGGILLAINLAWIVRPDLFGLPSGPGLSPREATLPARLALLSVAVWWLLFSIPLFRRIPEPPRKLEPGESRRESPVRASIVRIRQTISELRHYKQAFLMLIAFLIYGDGIGTIIGMAAIYGAEIGLPAAAMMGAILITQFVGVPFGFLFGMLAGRIGAKRSIFLGLIVYTFISIFAFFMTTATEFLILAVMVGMVQGGTQALSRSLFASMVPRHKSGEFFGFFGVIERFSGSMGPLLIAAIVATTGAARFGIPSVIIFFIVGGILFYFVDVEEGQSAARAAEVRAREVAAAQPVEG